MANIKSAKKRARQAVKRNERNSAQRSAMRTQVKALLKIIEKGNLADANAALRKTASILDKAAQKGLIHKNKAARSKSRLNTRVKKLVKK